MTRAVLFDINETVLDLAALDPLFEDWFGSADARKSWFSRTLRYAMTLAATRAYRPFNEVGGAALLALAEQRGVGLPEDARRQLAAASRRLPPHPDVAPALRHMQEAGLRTAALSNNPLEMLREQLDFAELLELFGGVMSVDETGALKPAPEVYRFAAKRLELPTGSIWMVAAHGWDIAGATRSGLRGALVARKEETPDPFAPPEVIGRNLVEVALAIVGRTNGQAPG